MTQFTRICRIYPNITYDAVHTSMKKIFEHNFEHKCGTCSNTIYNTIHKNVERVQTQLKRHNSHKHAG